MTRFQPEQLILVGVALLLLGWIFPFLSVIKVLNLPATSWTVVFWILVGAMQTAGLFVGFIGVATRSRLKRK
jgi:hypothetical protein